MSLLIVLAAVAVLGCRKGEAPASTEIAAPVPSRPADPSPSSAERAAAAQRVVAGLYQRHASGATPFFQAENRSRVDEFFEPGLAEIIWRDAVESRGEVGALGFDPLYNAQDTEIKEFVVHPATIEGSGANVLVTFTNHGKPERLTYSLVPVGTDWRISDITYADGSTLRGVFRTETPGT